MSKQLLHPARYGPDMSENDMSEEPTGEVESGESSTDRCLNHILENVAEDPKLLPMEKETTIRFAKDQSSFQLFTSEAGLIRRTLQHPEATDYSLQAVPDDAPQHCVSPEGYESGRVVGVTATLPVSTLTVSSIPRKSNEHADVISQEVLRNSNENSDTDCEVMQL